MATNTGSGATVIPSSKHPDGVTYGLLAERNPSRLDTKPGTIHYPPVLYPLQNVIINQLPDLPFKSNPLDLLIRRTPVAALKDAKLVPSNELWKHLRIVSYSLRLKEGHWDGQGAAPPSCIGVDGSPRLWVGMDLEWFWETDKPDGWEIMQVWVAYAPFAFADIWGTEEIPWE